MDTEKMDTKKTNRYFAPLSQIDIDQAKDTGMAMVLICLILVIITKIFLFNVIALVLLIINMTIPAFYKPVAIIWFGLSHLMGTIVSKIILSVIFYVLVTSVGLIRRFAGYDQLQLKKWKKNSSSVFTIRDHTFQPDDIDKPY